MNHNLAKPIKQHYVPRAYLNKFADKNNRLSYLDVRLLQQGKNSVVKSKGSKGLCAEDRFYSLSECTPGLAFRFRQYDDLFVESTVLKSLEDIYPKLYDLITLNTVISIDTAISFTDFIIQLKKRNPYNKKNAIEYNQKEWLEKVGTSLKQDILSGNTPFPAIPNAVKLHLADIMLTDINNDSQFARKAQMHSLISDHEGIAVNSKLKNAILNKDWVLIHAPANGPFFITSDNPGCSRDSETKMIHNTKFVAPFDFYLPMSPGFCFSISSHLPDRSAVGPSFKYITHLPAQPNDVYGINDCTIQCINRIIIGQDDSYLNEIRRLNLKTNLNNTIEK